MIKYLKNPYVIVGLIGIGFYLYKRRQLLAENPEAEKSVNKVEDKKEVVEVKTEETKDNFAGVPEQLKRDSAKMSTQTLKRTIMTNQKMLKRARLSPEKREQIKEALNYLKQEYKIRKN